MGKAFDHALAFEESLEKSDSEICSHGKSAIEFNFTDSREIVGKISADVDKLLNFEELCAYLKLYHARCRCILVFVDCSYEELEMRGFYITDTDKAKQQLNPFLKYRLLVITKDKMMTGSELMMRLIQ